jgi:hypothetical protein
VWDATSFTKNRERVLSEAIAQAFLSALLGDPKVKRLLSHEHFTVDGTLLKAWASMKSFRRKDGGDKPPDGGRNGERTSAPRSGRMRPTPARRTRMRGCIARARGRRASCATWAMS